MNDHLFLYRKTRGLIFMAIVIFLSSCIDGYKDDWTFSPGVEGDVLESPKVEDVVFTPNATEPIVVVSWPVVLGSGGYQFSLYIMDDPENPVVVGEENEIVDGCSVKRDLLEDTKYKAVIKTLGNVKYNNKDAVSASEINYSTLLTATTIPDGTDLADYFTENPIPETADEIAYELVAGGKYTMSNHINLGLTNVTIRGNKINHPTIKMGSGVFMSDGAGFKLKFLNFDCTNFSGNAVIVYNPTQNAAAISNGWIAVTSPVAIQNCKFTDLPKQLIFDSNKKYAVQNFIIKDCIVEQNTAKERAIYMQGGLIKDLAISNSTIYNKQLNDNYFIQYSSNRVTANAAWNWASGSVTLINNTLWQVATKKQMANYAGLAQKGNTLTVQKCIFVDCGNKEVIRRLAGGNTNITRVLGDNSYWFDGAFVSGEISNNYDNSGTHIESDPQLKNPSNGDFTVGGAGQIEKRTGDPRWLPLVEFGYPQ